MSCVSMTETVAASKMLNLSVTSDYTPDSSNAALTTTLNGGDFKVKATFCESAFDTRPSLTNLTLCLEKPASFSLDYYIPSRDLKFQIMNKGKVLNKEVNMTYTHLKNDNRMLLDGTLVMDDKNSLSGNYDVNTGNCKLKYSYVQSGVRSFEHCYDFAKNSSSLAVSQRVYGYDFLTAYFETDTRVLGLEWSNANASYGNFKVLASVNLSEKSKIPKLSAETTWNFDM